MISGRQALGSIDQTLTKAHDQIEKLQSEIGQTAEHLLDAQKAQAEDYRALARERLGRLDDSELIQHLDHAERQAVALLGQRDAALNTLRDRIGKAEHDRQADEAERTAQAARLDEAVGLVDEAEAETQRRLDEEAEYRAQRDAAEAAERKALHADEKAMRSEEEREAKGKAYRDDRLFGYLWDRHYGTPDYKASGLFRWLDDKVARLIGYADARVNYARLSEIPQRLREHASHVRASADAEFAKLRELDEIARRADGIPALEEKVNEQQGVLDSIDQRIDEAEVAHQEMLAEQARFAIGDDEFMRKAVDYLAREFQTEDLMHLRQDAVSTPYPEDDLIISGMLQRENEKRQLESTITGLKRALEQQQKRLAELESLRKDFKRKRFDRAGSVFAEDSMIPVLLGQFLAGMLDRGMLWKVLKEHQRYAPRRSDPGFGSGGFGRGTVWRGGLGDIGDIIGGARGRFGRGGFGGGGGGGGFRTGGGF